MPLKKSLLAALPISLFSIWPAAVLAASVDSPAKIDGLMSTLYQRGQFNGAPGGELWLALPAIVFTGVLTGVVIVVKRRRARLIAP